jgi:outer membrane protein
MTGSAANLPVRSRAHATLRTSFKALAVAGLLGSSILSSPAQAESISGALARAYASSPDLNAQRANTRAIDEGLPKATSGYRPTVTGTASVGRQYNEVVIPNAGGPRTSLTTPRQAALTVTETLYNGNRTTNGVRQADSQIFQAREQLRLSELNLLSNAATAYMNVLRDTAILNLRRNNTQVLQQQLRQTQDRFQVGEVTRTDVAQAESALAQGQADAFTAQSNLQNSIANYRQLIGVEPRNLSPARPVEDLLPRTLEAAIAISQREHPQVASALHAVDVAEYAIKIAEGALLPTLSVQGQAVKSYDYQSTNGQRLFSASATANLSVPLYQGGAEYAQIRQAKEQFGQARLQADLARDQVRAAVVSSWGVYQNARAVIQAQQAAVKAAEIALNGVREEAKVGQRTTLDVLNAQQALLNVRVNLVSAQRDRVVGSYSVLASAGMLSAQKLGLRVDAYDPTVHYDQVKDKWIGLRTPDGR